MDESKIELGDLVSYVADFSPNKPTRYGVVLFIDDLGHDRKLYAKWWGDDQQNVIDRSQDYVDRYGFPSENCNLTYVMESEIADLVSKCVVISLVLRRKTESPKKEPYLSPFTNKWV